MKVLLLTKYSRAGASSRLRFLQYIPKLTDEGVEITISSLFDDQYLEEFYADGRRPMVHSIILYLKRFASFLKAFRYDVLWIEKEIFPYFPAMFERLLALSGMKYIVDYDDAVFHNYDLASSALIRKLLGNKIDSVMAHASCVTAGNKYLADRARVAGAKKVEVIPTVVDYTRYWNVPRIRDDQLVIGWIGSPSTQKYVVDIREALKAACEIAGARLMLVGATEEIKNQLSGIPVEVIRWSEETEAKNIARMDVGIMPLVDGPWERGKCGYKLIQYMASGVPVIASPVGVNVEIVKGSGCGYLAMTANEWEIKLLSLLTNSGRRREMGVAGRDAVYKRYSLQAQLPKLVEILRDNEAGAKSC